MQLIRNHWQLLAILAVVFLLWRTPAVVPLKILVVFLHELSHAVAAWLTGGRVLEISLSVQQGGHAITQGGNVFLILSAGYLGSLVLGLALLLAALRSEADRAIVGAVGIVLLLVAVLYVRGLFALAFCVGTGAALLAAGWYLSHRACDLILRVIGLTSIVYVPYDIFSDTIARSSLESDAYMLGERFFGSAMFWGVIWLIISGAVIVTALRYGIGRASNVPWGGGR